MFGRSPSLLLKHLLTMIKLTVAFLLLSSTISAFTFKTFFGASSNNRGGCSSFGGGGYSRRGHSRSGRLDMSSKPPPSSPYDEYDDAIGAPVGPLPSVSSKINYGDQTPQNVCHDLWVVGSGTLGMLALKEWMSLYPDSKVVAETKTENRHAELSRLGVTPRLRSQRSGADDRTARYLLICIPPSASATYVEEIHSSCQLWAGPLGQGHMAFTSSTVVYGDSNGNTVDEIFRLDTRSQRSTQMIACEESVLSRGGSVVRLAGLYSADRGPHTFWLKNGTVNSNADGLVNMLHYEDAASAAIATMLRGAAGTVYLAADDEPLTREEICTAALASGRFPDAKMPVFSTPTGPVGKVCESRVTRSAIQWSPRPEHRTFANYMRNTLGGDATFETEKQRKARVRREKAGAVAGAPAADAAADADADVSSFLWIPGADDDLDSDIFKL